MKYVWTTLLSFLIALTMNTAAAQDRFAVELRVGPEFATQDLGDANLNTGFGSEVVFSYRFMSHLAAYGGWGLHKVARAVPYDRVRRRWHDGRRTVDYGRSRRTFPRWGSR